MFAKVSQGDNTDQVKAFINSTFSNVEFKGEHSVCYCMNHDNHFWLTAAVARFRAL